MHADDDRPPGRPAGQGKARGDRLETTPPRAHRGCPARGPPPPPGRSRRTPVTLTTFGGSGLQPGVDLDDSAALLDLMDAPLEVRDRANCVVVEPGERHWEIFTRLCQDTHAKGNLIADAYLAALALESGSEWITTDRDYARFPGLRWRHPFA